jgi:predicted DNA-binding transcriptional regulator AlpA
MDVSNIIRRLVRLDLTDNELEESIRALLSSSDTSIVDEDTGKVKEERTVAPEDLTDALPGDLLSAEEMAAKYGYTRAAIYWWERHPSGIVKRYFPPGETLAHYSVQEVEEYISRHGNPGLRKKVQPERYHRKATAKPKNGKSPQASSEEPIHEFDTVEGAAKRLKIKREMIRELVNSNKIASRKFYWHTVVSVREIEGLARGQRYLPGFNIFDNNEWLPLKEACSVLGLSYDDVNRYASDACAKGEIANRKIGNLRFVNVGDLERWYIQRQ